MQCMSLWAIQSVWLCLNKAGDHPKAGLAQQFYFTFICLGSTVKWAFCDGGDGSFLSEREIEPGSSGSVLLYWFILVAVRFAVCVLIGSGGWGGRRTMANVHKRAQQWCACGCTARRHALPSPTLPVGAPPRPYLGLIGRVLQL